MGKSVSSVNLNIGATSKQLRSELQRANASLKNFQKSVNTISSTFGVAFGGYAVFQGLKSSINKIADFHAEMSKAKAISGATGKEFENLKNNALEMGRSTKFTAQQVASLQVEFGKLGFSSAEIVNSTEATLALATATGEDLATAATVAGSTLRALQLDSSEMSRVTDVMAKSFTSSALDLSKFTESMKYAAPVAKSAGVSIEFTTAMLSALADAGISGSMAGTSMRRILNEMASTGKPAAEAFKEVAAKGVTLESAMDEVGRTAQTALTVLGANVDKVNELSGAYDNAAGSAAEMAAVVEDNLTGDLTKLGSAWDGLIQKGGRVSSALRDITQAMTFMINEIGGGDASEVQRFKRIMEHVGLQENLNTLKNQEGILNDAIATGDEEKVSLMRQYIATLKQVIKEKQNIQGVEGPDLPGKSNAMDTVIAEKLKEELEKQKELEENRKAAFEAFKKEQDEKSKILDDYYASLQAQQDEAIDKWKYEQDAIKSLASEWVDSTEKVKTGLAGLNETLDGLDLSLPEHEDNAAGEAMADEIKKTAEAEKQSNEQRVANALYAGEQIGAALAMEGEDRKRAVQDAIKSNAAMILSDLIRSAVANIPFPFNIAAGGIAAAAGTALINKIPALAEGGIVTGPTLAMIGEGKHPEAVIPLPNGINGLTGGGNNSQETLTARVSGSDLMFILERQQRRVAST